MSHIFVAPIRIAFGHRARVGKDEAAMTYKKYLISKYSHAPRLLSFAQPIYDILYETQLLCGFRDFPKDRQFLQFVGEWAKSQDSNVWVNQMRQKIKQINESIIVTDLRFTNEAEMLKFHGFKLIRIDNPNVPVIEHHSEHDLDEYTEWDAVIHNDCSLDEFHRRVIDTVNICMPPTQYEEEKNNERFEWCSNLPDI